MASIHCNFDDVEERAVGKSNFIIQTHINLYWSFVGVLSYCFAMI